MFTKRKRTLRADDIDLVVNAERTSTAGLNSSMKASSDVYSLANLASRLNVAASASTLLCSEISASAPLARTETKSIGPGVSLEEALALSRSAACNSGVKSGDGNEPGNECGSRLCIARWSKALIRKLIASGTSLSERD